MPTKRCFTSRLAHAHKIIHEQTETGSQGAVQTTVLKWNKMRRNKGEIGTDVTPDQKRHIGSGT